MQRQLMEALDLIDHQCTCSGDCDRERLGAASRIRRVIAELDGTESVTSVAADSEYPQNSGTKPEDDKIQGFWNAEDWWQL